MDLPVPGDVVVVGRAVVVLPEVESDQDFDTSNSLSLGRKNIKFHANQE